VSRIAGAAGAPADLDALLAACGLPDGRRQVAEPLGWVGSGAPGLARGERVLVALDGAIHNRASLGGDERGDAALLARLVEAHGVTGAARRCNGEFAFAVWDRGTLWLGRDRIGVRPLYYAVGRHGLAFASRPRALLGLDWVSREVNRTYAGLVAGSHYRTFDNDRNASPYRDIAQLPGGHVLRFDGAVSLESYWSLEDLPDFDDSPEDLAERYRELLLDAVRIRLGSSPQPAFTLSGGMDSSTVIASAAHTLGTTQHAFSSVYGAHEFDESEEIRSMLDSAVCEWHPIAVADPDVFNLVDRMVAVHDEPVATATWLSHYLVCDRVADGGFSTLFGGLGGDELNAGEYEYFFYRFADLRAAGDEDQLRTEVREWVRHHDHPVFRKSWDVMDATLQRVVDLGTPGRILPDRARIERYRHAVNREFFDVAGFEPVMDTPFSSYLKNRTYQDMVRETAPPCLRAEDRQTAAFGLTSCDPFFDHRLIEFMFRVPGDLKIRDGVTKQLLRRATVGLLPNETRTRIKKTGWNAPADAWFSGPGKLRVLELIEDPGFAAAEVYDLRAVRALLDEHDEIVDSGRPAENHMMFFWQLVNVEAWLRWLKQG
jgi:asparagine synthase (glutamine-hydrolysing)